MNSLKKRVWTEERRGPGLSPGTPLWGGRGGGQGEWGVAGDVKKTEGACVRRWKARPLLQEAQERGNGDLGIEGTDCEAVQGRAWSCSWFSLGASGGFSFSALHRSELRGFLFLSF